MNKNTFITIIGWESRNNRHKLQAVSLCKNYGLKAVLKNLYIGSLYERERSAIQSGLAKVFITKTEKFFMGVMCQSCAVELDTSSKKMVNKLPQFEIVEFSNLIDKKFKKAI